MASSSRDLTNRLLRRARARIRESTILSRQYLEERRAREPSLIVSILCLLALPLLLLCCVLCLFFPLPLIFHAIERLGPQGALGLFSLASLLAAQLLTLIPRLQLKRSQRLSVLAHLPVPDRDIAWQVMRDWCLVSLLLLWICLWFYGRLYWALELPLNWYGIAGLAVTEWLVCVSAVPLLTAWIRERPMMTSFYVILIAGAAFCCLGVENVTEANRVAFFCFPTGWANGIMQFVVVDRQPWAYLLLLPIAIWMGLGLWSQYVLVATYRIEEVILRQGVPAEATARDRSTLAINLAAESVSRLQRMDADAEKADEQVVTSAAVALEVIRQREFLDTYEWAHLGWIERLAQRWLTSRELAVIDVLTSSQIQWTQMWKTSLVQIPVFFLFTWLFQNGSVFIGLMVVFSGLPVALMGLYPAFRARTCGGVYLSQLAAFPVTRDEVERVIFKVTMLRGLASTSFTLIPFAVITMHLPFWPLEGMAATIGVSIFLLLLTPWLFVTQFSFGSGFPDWRLLNLLRRVMLLVPMIVVCFEFPVAVALFSMPAQFIPTVATILLSLFLSCTFLTYYLSRRFHSRGSVDMVRSSPHYWDTQTAQFEQAHVRGRRNSEMFKKHGWFWWLKRGQQKAETA